MKTKHVVLTLLATITLNWMAVSCTFDDPLDGFSGLMETQQGTVYSVAHFDQFRLPKYKSRMNIVIHQVLGDATGENLKIIFNWFKKTIVLDYPRISPLPVTLTASSADEEKTCGTGDAHGNSIFFCYGWGALFLTLKDLNGNNILKIDLKRGIDFQYALSPTLTLNETLGRARFSDYRVRQYAERVYRAREQIQNNKSKLYPKFNLRTVVGLALAASTGTVSGFVIFDIADNFLPFVYPANWFQVGVAKKNFAAEIVAFQSLQANQMLAAQTLFYSIQKDYEILAKMEARMEQLRELATLVKQRNFIGDATDAQLNSVNDKVALSALALSDFKTKVLDDELAAFAQTLAIRQFHNAPPTLTLEDQQIDQLKTMSEEERNHDLETAKINSFEIQTLKHLKESAHDQFKATTWSFLAPGSGLFIDASYMSQGRISTSSENELQIKLDETEAILEKNIIQISNRYNASINDYAHAYARLISVQNNIQRFNQVSQWNKDRLKTHDTLYDLLLGAEISVLESKTALLTNLAAYQRLTISGRYAALDDYKKVRPFGTE